MDIKYAVKHFLEFHKGTLNIILHVIGFVGIFYSVYKLDWMIFGLSFIVLEIGHVYNHFIGIKKYDLRLRVICIRLLFFAILVGVFYGINFIVK